MWFSGRVLTAVAGLLLLTPSSLAAPACRPTTAPTAPVTVLTEFPFPSWAENFAVRSNGKLLVSRLDAPAVYEVDQVTGAATLVYAWDKTAYFGCLGIAETTPDVFFVVVSNFVDEEFLKTSGTTSIYRIDMAPFRLGSTAGTVAHNATVTKLVDVPEAQFFNGMVKFDDQHVLVAAPSTNNVWKINTVTGAYAIAYDDPKMAAAYVAEPTAPLGVNGVKIFDGYLYWSNTGAGFLARLPIASDGTATGSSSIAVTGIPKVDDFIIRSDGVAFLCQNQQNTLSVAYLKKTGSVAGIPIAGSLTSTTVAGITAAHFGRTAADSSRLYLTTSGGLALPINGTITVPGTVDYIDASVY